MSAEPVINVINIGKEGRPVAVIDDFFPEAERLRSVAKESSFIPALNLYPGIRANLPDFYWSNNQLKLVEAVAEQVFSLSGKVNLIDSSFSIVTTPREELKMGQRMPHIDGFRRNQIALVHYLSPAIKDGTAFYRHRSTGLEFLNEDLRHFYFHQVDQELQQVGLPEADYIDGDTQMFERIGEVSGKFNRALLYLGSQLHSGVITAKTPLCADPCVGRLTVTAFMTID